MLAGLRSYLPIFFLLLVAAANLPALAQVNGIPASVTSLGFGGSNNPFPGVRASVTSLGDPAAFAKHQWPTQICCLGVYWPMFQTPPEFSGRHRHRDRDLSVFPVGIFEPVYVPYGVPYGIPYEVEADDQYDGAPDAVETRAVGPRKPEPPDSRVVERTPARPPQTPAKSEPAAAPVLENEVLSQPPTVLVFKDGHQASVLNYVIAGDALFDLSDGRSRKILLSDLDLPATRKANDERGVDFQLPARSTR